MLRTAAFGLGQACAFALFVLAARAA